jgi:hypothetical protein
VEVGDGYGTEKGIRHFRQVLDEDVLGRSAR